MQVPQASSKTNEHSALCAHTCLCWAVGCSPAQLALPSLALPCLTSSPPHFCPLTPLPLLRRPAPPSSLRSPPLQAVTVSLIIPSTTFPTPSPTSSSQAHPQKLASNVCACQIKACLKQIKASNPKMLKKVVNQRDKKETVCERKDRHQLRGNIV